MTERPALGCDLCGATGRNVTMALLRVAWERRTVMVKACPAHAAVAWRTVDELRAELAADPVVRRIACEVVA